MNINALMPIVTAIPIHAVAPATVTIAHFNVLLLADAGFAALFAHALRVSGLRNK